MIKVASVNRLRGPDVCPAWRVTASERDIMACLEAERVPGDDQVASISGAMPLRALAGFTHVARCGQDHRPAERHLARANGLTLALAPTGDHPSEDQSAVNLPAQQGGLAAAAVWVYRVHGGQHHASAACADAGAERSRG